MHRLLVWTGKGGTGKTTTCANLAPALARDGYRVLLVGFDPQSDLETTFGIDDDDRDVVRIEQLLGGGIDPVPAAIEVKVPKAKGSLRLLPTSPDLNSQLAAVARTDFESLNVLLERFEDDADLAIIDTQGALTPLSRAALLAADSVLFSCEPGFYESRAIVKRLDEIDELAAEDERWAVDPLGILLVRTSGKSRHMREYREHFSGEDFDDVPVFEAFVRQETAVRDHPRGGRPTILAAPKSKVAEDYAAVAREVARRLSAKVES